MIYTLHAILQRPSVRNHLVTSALLAHMQLLWPFRLIEYVSACADLEDIVSQSSNRRVAAPRQLSLHAMCSSNAVLARDSTGPVFGNGRPGDSVAVELARGSTVIKKVRCLPRFVSLGTPKRLAHCVTHRPHMSLDPDCTCSQCLEGEIVSGVL